MTRLDPHGDRAALLRTATLGELRALAKEMALDDSDAELLIARAPPWLPEAAQAVLENNPGCWHFARQLVRRGACAPPATENYVLGMYNTHGFKPWSDKRSLADFLLDDPELVAGDLWRIFEVEGGGELSLAAHDKYTRADATWSRALLSLLERGHLSRERLLDASLAALERDFAAFRAGWFSRFHEQLAPTPAERHARRAIYLRLLGSPIPATVSFAFEAVKVIDAHEALPAAEVLPFIGPVLVARQKGTAKAAVKLLGAIAAREPGSRAPIARAAVAALSHEAAEVQGAALALIEKHGDASAASQVAARAGQLAPSVAGRLAKAPAPSSEIAPAPVAVGSRLAPERALAPLGTVDEVLERLGRLLEDAGDPDEIELALDGVLRLCADVPADFAKRIAPLVKRARAIRKKDGAEWTLPFALAGVVLAWAGEDVEAGEDDGGVLGLFNARAHAVAVRARARSPGALLSAPTHRGGWIDPRVLIERARAAGEIDVADASLAILRLALEAPLPAGDDVEGELGAALRHAFGGAGPVGPTAALWIAAARAKAPREDDDAVEARHPGLGPDAGKAARLTWKVSRRKSDGHTFHDFTTAIAPRAPKKLRRDLPSTHLHQAAGDKPILRWAATLWPSGTESFFARGVARIGENLDWWEAEWPNAAYLEPLRDPFTSFGPNATLLLALGLAAKEPGESGLSVDAAVAALAERRLTGLVLGETMAALMPTGLVKAARWAKTLAVVAQTSPFHAAEVAAAIQRSLRGDPTLAPRDEGTLVALLRELLLGAGAKVTDPDAAAYLAASRHEKKLAGVLP